MIEEKENQEVLAKVIRLDDGFHVVDKDGTVGPVCTKRTTDGYVILTPNASNRKCISEKTATKFFDDGGTEIPLYYKATRVIGVTTKMPNEKLISYLSEDLQEEYKAIYQRGIDARNADKVQPKTELEKAQAKLAKAQAALDALMAQANN